MKHKISLRIKLIFLVIIASCNSNDNDELPTTVKVEEFSLNPNSTGLFKFSPLGFYSDKEINVYYHIPPGDVKNLPILLSLHGGNRNADDYRDCWIDMSNTDGFMVFAPEFNDINFPSGDQYNLANIFQDGDNPSPETYNSSEKWTFLILDQLFDHIVKIFDGNQINYNAWGHSAGAQFLHRFVIYKPESKLNIAVCSNAGWYTVPEKGISFPYGLDKGQLDDSVLKKAFLKKLYVHLGEEDTNPNSSSLRHNESVDAQQGITRRARGRYFYKTAKENAEILNTEFNWIKTQEVKEVAHDYELMARDALQYFQNK